MIESIALRRAAGAGGVSLLVTALFVALFAAPGDAAARDAKAGPRDTVVIERNAPAPRDPLFAALSIDPAALAGASQGDTRPCALRRIGPRNTIPRCR
jgi:hypothetical protein